MTWEGDENPWDWIENRTRESERPRARRFVVVDFRAHERRMSTDNAAEANSEGRGGKGAVREKRGLKAMMERSDESLSGSGEKEKMELKKALNFAVMKICEEESKRGNFKVSKEVVYALSHLTYNYVQTAL